MHTAAGVSCLQKLTHLLKPLWHSVFQLLFIYFCAKRLSLWATLQVCVTIWTPSFLFFFPVEEQQMTSEVVPAMISQKRQSVAKVHNLHSLKTPPPLLHFVRRRRNQFATSKSILAENNLNNDPNPLVFSITKKPWQWRLLKLSLPLSLLTHTHALTHTYRHRWVHITVLHLNSCHRAWSSQWSKARDTCQCEWMEGLTDWHSWQDVKCSIWRQQHRATPSMKAGVHIHNYKYGHIREKTAQLHQLLIVKKWLLAPQHLHIHSLQYQHGQRVFFFLLWTDTHHVSCNSKCVHLLFI